MTGRVQNKIALITGAARGQGRSHAIRLAEEGADIIAIDLCGPLPDVSYKSPSFADLEETARLVEALDRRIHIAQADVRDLEQLRGVTDEGVAELGGLDIVSANAAILAPPARAIDTTEEVWQSTIDINLTGVFHTAKVTIPHLLARGGGSMIITSSSAGLRGVPNISNYVAAKHGVVGLMKTLALEYGAQGVRVNSVHPTQVNTDMIMHDEIYTLFRPDLKHPTRDDFAVASREEHVLPHPWVEPRDISNAVLFLASDEARFITGESLRVDLGVLAGDGRVV